LAQAEPLQLKPLALPSHVYDSQGHTLTVMRDADYRAPVTLSQVPPQVRNAVIDAEDAGFYRHGAISIPSIARALKNNVGSPDLQGGSTITQQLVKNSVLTPQRTVSRKVREAALAFRLEQQMSKDQILERYLNTVYFGNGAYGIQAAAATYFGLDVGRLNPAQGALLAGLIRDPSASDPVHNPAAAVQRRNEVLDAMVTNGHLDATQAALSKLSPLPTRVNVPPPEQDSPFVAEVKASLLDLNDHSFDALGTTTDDRLNALNRGGLNITTTQDPAMQHNAEVAVATRMPDTGGRFTAALVAMDPTTGFVRALVPGNPGSNQGYDVATGRGSGGRQPGSSFKPFVLMAALDNGYSPNDSIDGTAPCTIALPDSPRYVAHNAEQGAGVMNLWDATANSVNCAYIRLGVDVGLDNVVKMAHRMGIPASTNLGTTPSVSIGAYEVTPLQMASAYSTLANNGVHHDPSFVEKVTDRSGNVIFQASPAGTPAVPAQEARVTTQALEGVVQRGTGTAANIGRPVAGKTGTTDNLANAWFVGYTPQLVTAVWMGSPTAQVPMYGVGGVDVFGGTYPAGIFHDFMQASLSGQPVQGFPGPYPTQIPPGQFRLAQHSPGSLTSPPPPPPAPSTGAAPSPPDTTPIPPSSPPPVDTSPGTSQPGPAPQPVPP
jgi:penicillin-binding protein 1A